MPVVRELTKPTGIGFDELNDAIEALSTGDADSVLAKVEQPSFVGPEHLDYLFDRLHFLRITLFEQALKKRLAPAS